VGGGPKRGRRGEFRRGIPEKGSVSDFAERKENWGIRKSGGRTVQE